MGALARGRSRNSGRPNEPRSTGSNEVWKKDIETRARKNRDTTLGHVTRPVLALVAALLLVPACGVGSNSGSNTSDRPPITTAFPGGGTYGTPLTVVLSTEEQTVPWLPHDPPTIYYSTDGADPSVGGANTSFGPGPLGVALAEGTTLLKFFAIDSQGNTEGVQTHTYVIDITAPTITISSGVPGPIGLLASEVVTWQSSEAGSYIVEIGGSGTPGSGLVLAKGTAAAFSPIDQMIAGTQLVFSGATPLWIYATDAVGHTGSTSVNLNLKPLVPMSLGGELGQVVVRPDGRRAYVARQGVNSVAVIDADPASGSFNTVLATVPVGFRPTGVAATPNSNRIYVTNQGQTNADVESISAIDTSTNMVVATIPLGTSSAPNGIAITPDGTRAYFLRFEEEISVLDINPTSPTYHTITASIPRTLLLMGAIGMTPDGTKAVVNWQGSIAHGVDVLDINPSSPTYNTIVSSPVPVVSGLLGDVAMTSDSGSAFATDSGNSLCRINLQTSVVGPTGTPAPQWAFA